jgi:hypothetical protein
MDPDLVRVEAVPQEVRRKVLDYVTGVKGVKPSELGYDASYLYRVRRGMVQVSDELFKALLKHIDVDEYARLVGSAPPLVEATPDDVIRVVKKALVDKGYRNCFSNYSGRPLVTSSGSTGLHGWWLSVMLRSL